MNSDKKYHITLGIMIFLFIIIIAGALAVGLGIVELNFAKSNKSNNVSQESTNTEQKVEDNNDELIGGNGKNEEGKMTSEEKRALIIPYISEKSDKKECPLGDGCELVLNVNLPKINLDTQTVKNINLKLKDIYIQANEQFKNPNSRPISYDITYNSNYVEKVDCIWISIENRINNTHATGGYEAVNIIYLVESDKQISFEEFLSSKDITRDSIKEKIRKTNQYINGGFDEEYLTNLVNDYSRILIKDITNEKIILQTSVDFEMVEMVFNY